MTDIQNLEYLYRVPHLVAVADNQLTLTLSTRLQGATITEAFSPLIKFDFKFKKPGLLANFEIKKDKTVNLNITGPQIIETKGQEYVVGVGYRFPNLTIRSFKN
jgi:cell surface protein SprA